MLKIVSIIFMLMGGVLFGGCITAMEHKSESSEIVMEKNREKQTEEISVQYSEIYIAVEYPEDKYEEPPVMIIDRYNDGSAILSMRMGEQTGIYGTCPYGVWGMVTLYTGSESLRSTYARAEITIMDNRATILFTYPMGDCETISYEKEWK